MDILLIIIILLILFGAPSGLYIAHGDPVWTVIVILIVVALLGVGGWRWRGPRE
jgi:membrane protein YdbS with pleckstrin-like domain